ncbi:phage portal protein [Leptospira levettii]|uniref:Phage portal protein n=1 Tax=Leptospira levettii TaxID=2023178 RepID=A0ABY2MTR1_9LEPT|nr:phage portal protein [Leptospira levettii]
MPRPRGKNYDKNLFYRTPPELREKVVTGKAKPIDEHTSSDPRTMTVEEFRKSAFYSHTRSTVKQAIDLNNRMFNLLETAKDKKNPIYSDDMVVPVQQGVRVRPIYRIPLEDLRNISYASSLIGAIHQIMADDVSMYAKIGEDPGFEINLKQKDVSATDLQRQDMASLANRVFLMGDKSQSDWRERERLGEVLEMATRDTLAIDAVAYLRTYNRAGEICDVRYLDPATIFRVDPRKGYKGDKNITHVQMVHNTVTETYEAGRIVYRHKNNLSDIRMRGFGYSPIESCLVEIMSLLFTIKHNADRFNSRNPPKAIISSKNAIPKSDQERIELIWENAFFGPREGFKIPMMFGAGEIQVHNLDVSDDFEFDKMLQMVSSFIIARHGIDPAQLGLRLNQSQSLAEPSMDGRQHFSRDRAHGSIMSFHQDCLNEVFDPSDESPIALSFIGVKTEQEDKKADLEDKQFKVSRSMDEIRKANDLPTMKEEADDYVARGIITKEQGEKMARLGLLRGNQYFSQEFGKIFSDEGQPQSGGDGGQPPIASDGNGELPWGEDDFLPST